MNRRRRAADEVARRMAVGNTKVFFVAIFLVFFVIIFLGNTKVFFVVIFPAQEQCIAKLNLTISGKRERK